MKDLKQALNIVTRCCERKQIEKEASVIEALDSLEQAAKKLEKITNIVYDCKGREVLTSYMAIQLIEKVLKDEL